MKTIDPFKLAYLLDFIEVMRPMRGGGYIDFSLLARRLAEHNGLPILLDALDRAFADPVLLEHLLAHQTDEVPPDHTNRSSKE